VREARAARQSWAELAALLPWRPAASVKKLYLGGPPLGRRPQSADAATARAPSPAPPPAPTRALPPSASRSRVVVATVPPTATGEARVSLHGPLDRPQRAATVAAAHGAAAAAGARFFAAATVIDADDDAVTYSFDLSDPDHGACFATGAVDGSGAPLLSWARLVALYSLPGGGGAWAETRVLVDAGDWRQAVAARRGGAARPPPPDLAARLAPRELLLRGGRVHSRLQHAGAECWLHRGGAPARGAGGATTPAPPLTRPPTPDDAWFWRTAFDPATLLEEAAESDGGEW